MGSGITRLCDGDISWLLWGEVGGEVGGVGTVGLVCVSRLLRMGGESLLLPVWKSVRDGFTGQSDC